MGVTSLEWFEGGQQVVLTQKMIMGSRTKAALVSSWERDPGNWLGELLWFQPFQYVMASLVYFINIGTAEACFPKWRVRKPSQSGCHFRLISTLSLNHALTSSYTIPKWWWWKIVQNAILCAWEPLAFT